MKSSMNENYSTKCPHKKTSKKTSRGAISEALASQFELDFTLITCMAMTMMGSVWHLEGVSLFHMTGNTDFFTDLEEKDLEVHIEMGYHGRYNTTTVHAVTFKREMGSPISLKEVMSFLGLKKNLVSVVVLEDLGYNVNFNKGKDFLRQISIG